ncbi:MAG: hypothetical protein JNM20_16315 [Rhizobiales bacterium]|nr:hypothetical protein [Hyphomicrobiales bacterium]
MSRHDGKTLGPVGRIALALLLAWALAMIVPDLRRVWDPLASVGFYANGDGLVYDETGPFARNEQSPSWRAGIRDGDRIDLEAMRCQAQTWQQCGSVLAVLGGFEYLLPGAQISVKLSPGSPSGLESTTLTAEPLKTSIVFRAIMLLNAMAGIAVVLAAAWLVWIRPGPMSWGFFLFVSWYNPSQGFVFYAFIQQWPPLLLAQDIFGSFLQGAALAGLLLFTIRAPNDRVDPQWRWLERAIPSIGLAIGILIALSYLNAFGHPTEILTRTGILTGFAVDFAAIGILLSRRRSLAPEDNQRLRWVLWGCLIGLPAFIFAEIAQETTLLETRWGDVTPNDVLIALLYLANGVFCLFVFEAVRRQRVVNVTIPLRRVTILGLSLSIPALLLHEAARELQDDLGLPGWAWLCVGALIAYAISRIHEFSVEAAERFFNRHLDRIGEELARLIASARTIGEVETHLTHGPLQHLHLTSAATFRRDGDGFARHTEGDGWEEGCERRLDASAPLLSPVVGRQRLADLGSTGERDLNLPDGAKRPIVGVPATIRGRVLAVALYGPHRSGADLDSNERALLERLGDAAAEAYVAIENDELKKRLRDFESKV